MKSSIIYGESLQSVREDRKREFKSPITFESDEILTILTGEPQTAMIESRPVHFLDFTIHVPIYGAEYHICIVT